MKIHFSTNDESLIKVNQFFFLFSKKELDNSESKIIENEKIYYQFCLAGFRRSHFAFSNERNEKFSYILSF